MHYNAASKHCNAIFGREGEGTWKLLHGPAVIEETLDLTCSPEDGGGQCPALPRAVRLRFPPTVFRQANLDAFARIVAHVRRRLAEYVAARGAKPACVELYGGVGTIGLHLADLCASLVSSDENPFNVDCFNATASQLRKKVRRRVSYVPKNAADMAQAGALTDAEVCVVDPPRKGLEPEVVAALNQGQRLRLLVYVSCGFSAFQRDCRALLAGENQWRLEHAEGHILFPGADAIETLAFFVRE